MNISEDDLDIIVHKAVRYCLSRQTYVSLEAAGSDGWLRRIRPLLSQTKWHEIHREIRADLRFQSEIDRPIWQDFLNWANSQLVEQINDRRRILLEEKKSQ
jgi:hypothetical protein